MWTGGMEMGFGRWLTVRARIDCVWSDKSAVFNSATPELRIRKVRIPQLRRAGCHIDESLL